MQSSREYLGKDPIASGRINQPIPGLEEDVKLAAEFINGEGTFAQIFITLSRSMPGVDPWRLAATNGAKAHGYAVTGNAPHVQNQDQLSPGFAERLNRNPQPATAYQVGVENDDFKFLLTQLLVSNQLLMEVMML